MKKATVLAFAFAAALSLGASSCKERSETVYRGVPDGVHASCRSVTNSGDVLACVGQGKSYTCVKDGEAGNETHYWDVYECARVSAPVLPEEPKSE